MRNNNIENLQDFYRQMGIEQNSVDASNGFTIHHVQDIIKTFPFRSERFRPNYYNFLF